MRVSSDGGNTMTKVVTGVVVPSPLRILAQ